MSPEERDLLYKTHELAEENNKILRSLRNAQRWDRVIKYGYWVVIIALTFGAYYLIQPYLEMLTSFVRSPGGDLNKAGDLMNLINGL